MVSLGVLWLPILLSAVIVFVASSVLHMVIPWHHSDFRPLPDEAGVANALRGFALPPGDYHMPRPNSAADLKSPDFRAKLNAGPNIVMTVMPLGGTNMGKSLLNWFIYIGVVALFAGYIASHALRPGATYGEVFRFVGAPAFMGFALALAQQSIWYSRSWTTTIKSMIDGLFYAFLTAGTFGWLWPR